jgi:hypothetical protein
MSNDLLQSDSPAASLKNEESRQRWELFHRAIAHAKQSNVSAMQEADDSVIEAKRNAPILSIAR